MTAPTYSGAMDLPLGVLARTVRRLAAHPDLHFEQQDLLSALHILQAVRIGVAAMEGRSLSPSDAPGCEPGPVVDLRRYRSARCAAPEIGGTG